MGTKRLAKRLTKKEEKRNRKAASFQPFAHLRHDQHCASFTASFILGSKSAPERQELPAGAEDEDKDKVENGSRGRRRTEMRGKGKKRTIRRRRRNRMKCKSDQFGSKVTQICFKMSSTKNSSMK